MSKIPNQAKCVFNGVVFDVYQWEQELYNGKTTTFEIIKEKPAVQVIGTTKENKIIMLKEIQPHRTEYGFSLIGGGCDSYDEDPLECAKRELLEETGMVCENIELFKTKSSGGKLDFDVFYYIANNCEKIQEQQLDGGEKIEVLEVSFEEFLENCEHETFRNPYFSDMLFRIKHTPKQFKEFKEKLKIN